MNNDFSGIYCIENRRTNEKYIGRSKNIFKRWATHKKMLNAGKHRNRELQEAWYIDNFSFYILELCNESAQDEREMFWISKYNTFHGAGYNATPGGNDAEYIREHGFRPRRPMVQTKSSIDKARKVSKAITYLLQGQPLTFITENSGLSLDTVKRIKHKRAWTDMTEGMEFPKVSPVLAKKYRDVCFANRRIVH